MLWLIKFLVIMPRFISWLTLNFSSIILAVSINILFGLVKLINLLSIRFYYFYSSNVINIVFFSSSIDLWIWGVSLLFIVLDMFLMKILFHLNFPRWIIFPYLLSLASLVFFLIDYRIASIFTAPLGFIVVGLSVFFGNGFLVAKREEVALLIAMGVLGFLITFELAALSSWLLNAFDHQVPFGSGLRWRFPWIDLQLFNVLYPLTSWLFLILLYSWIWIPALRHMLSRIRGGSLFKIQTLDKLNIKSVTVGLLLSLATAIFVSSYSYIHLPSSTLVGADSIFYYDRLKEMQTGPYVAFESDRPLFNLLMYFIMYVAALSPQAVVRIMPVISAVSLNLAVFWFVKVGTKDVRLALLSSLFSSFSFQATVGIFAYSVANWFAMTESFLLLAFLLKSSEKHLWRHVVISALIGMALLLTHLYTWNVLIVILFSYLMWMLLRRSETKWEIASLTILLAANLLFHTFYTLTPFGGGVSNGQAAILSTTTSNVNISNLFYLQNGIASMVQRWVGGLFANPLLIILAVVGMFSMINLAEGFRRIMQLWVVIPSLALLAVSPGQDFLYYRLIYLIPLQILAAAGLCWILNKLQDTERKGKLNATSFYILKILLITLVVLLLLNNSLRSVDEAVTHMPEL